MKYIGSFKREPKLLKQQYSWSMLWSKCVYLFVLFSKTVESSNKMKSDFSNVCREKRRYSINVHSWKLQPTRSRKTEHTLMNFFCGLHSPVHFAETSNKAVSDVEKEICKIHIFTNLSRKISRFIWTACNPELRHFYSCTGTDEALLTLVGTCNVRTHMLYCCVLTCLCSVCFDKPII